MSDNRRFDEFFHWLQALDPTTFLNEAEVESKFIVPFFQHLGYPEACRHSQYSLKMYEPRRRSGRGQAIDQIYFSTIERKQQTGDTSLLLIEAKEPGETHFEEALEQARSYGYHLTPLFLIVTNAHRLLVVKRHRHRGEETVFDVTFCELCQETTANRLYRQLHFDVVKSLKEQYADELTHTLSVDLTQALNHYPDLREQLAKSDFERLHLQEGKRLTVVEPKVAIVCDLPVAFGDGACRITFSSLLLRGLTCHLTHRQILESLMTGLDTRPSWGTRRFLKQTAEGGFEAQLGQTTVILSEQEASELCACVDAVCHAYKAILINTEDLLQTWDYRPRSLAGFQLHGFELLSIKPWLWECMLQFAREFDIFEGDSSWHIFDRGNRRLRVLSNREVENVLIRPFYGDPAFPRQDVELIYCIEEDGYLAVEEEWSAIPWQQAVGPKGRWTAQYTEQWLTNTFIPHVLAHYPTQQPENADERPYWSWGTALEKQKILTQISLAKDLAPYLDQIQRTFHVYENCQLPALLLRPYYAALLELVQQIDPSQLAVRYTQFIQGYVSGATRLVTPHQLSEAEEEVLASSDEDTTLEDEDDLSDSTLQDHMLRLEFVVVEVEQDSELEADDPLEHEEDFSPVQEVNDIMSELREHVKRIHAVDHESPRVADFLSCAFIALLEHGIIHCRQEHLNTVKDAIQPLLDLSRFEERYVLRLPWE